MTGWALALGVGVVAAVVVTLATTRPPQDRPADLDTYLDRWAELHGGYDPRAGAATRVWLPLVHRLAGPMARRGVHPDALTLWGAVASLAVVACCAAGGAWVALAVVVVVVSGLLDNLDGAVAVATGRTTRFGYVLDSLVDRVSDVLYVVALVVLGAPTWVAATGAVLMFLQEYARARAGAAGMSEVGVVTVWERPTRVVVTAVALLGAALASDHVAATVGAWAWVGLGVVGTTQLLVKIRSALSGPVR